MRSRSSSSRMGTRLGASGLLHEALELTTHGSAENLKKEVEQALASIA